MKLARILAATDFSDRSRVALVFAARLACRFGAELHVLHAQDPLLSAAAEHHGLNLLQESEDELRALVGESWPAMQCSLHFDVVIGRAAPAIVHAAKRECADLVVMSAHGMSGAEHALLGSTTESVLRHSNVAVLVVPDEWVPASPETPDLRGEGPVIVGVDFHMPSIEAAGDGAALARSLETELVLIHVAPSLRVLGRWRAHADAALVQRAAEARVELDQLLLTVSKGVPSRALVVRGRVDMCLGEVATPHPHAILVLGRTVHPHGYAAPGTTAYRALARARVPVLMHVSY